MALSESVFLLAPGNPLFYSCQPHRASQTLAAYTLHNALVNSLPGNDVAPCLAEAWQEATMLAQALQADLLLMDDKDGRQAAAQRSLTVFGTLGVLERGAEQGLVDLPEVLTLLLATNFYASARIIQELLACDAARKAEAAQRAAEAARSVDAGQAPERSP